MTVAVGPVWLLSPSYIRTARKQHRCEQVTRVADSDERVWCPRPIEIGSRYVEYLGEVPCWQAGSRYHLDCARLQGVLADERPYWHRQACRLPWADRDAVDARACACGGEPAPYNEAAL